MFGIGSGEFVSLLVLAVLLTPPDKLPEMSRKAARVLYFLRNIANNATSQLREELGPDYADLTVEDLNPKTFVKKHLVGQLEQDLADIKNDLDDVRGEINHDLEDATTLAKDASGELTSAVAGLDTVDSAPSVPLVSPFDDEAT